MADSPMKTITAEIPEDLYNALVELANKRGVSANTVLSQAISTEKYLADTGDTGAKVLVERPDRKLERLVPTTRRAD